MSLNIKKIDFPFTQGFSISCANKYLNNILFQGWPTLLYQSAKNDRDHHWKSRYTILSLNLRIFVQIESDDFFFEDDNSETVKFFIPTAKWGPIFFGDPFQRQYNACAAFHRPQNLTCCTAVYTFLLFITVYKSKMKQKSRSQGPKGSPAAVWPPLFYLNENWKCCVSWFYLLG